MSQFTLKFILGAASRPMPGQWLEGSVEFGEESFALSVDVCRASSAGEFSMYRLHERLDEPFTAELFLGLLGLIAEDEFRPSTSGIELSYSGEGAAPSDEIARIMEPEVRGRSHPPPGQQELFRPSLSPQHPAQAQTRSVVIG